MIIDDIYIYRWYIDDLAPNHPFFFLAGGVDLPIDALRRDGLAGLSGMQKGGGVGGERTKSWSGGYMLIIDGNYIESQPP